MTTTEFASQRPNLHILGVQKAGTTALASFLAEHPDICVVEGKEAHVFDDPAYFRARDKDDFIRNKYASKLLHYQGQRYICDATPITLFHPAFLSACVNSNTQARYIVILRNPVDRAFSQYQMSKKRGLEPLSPFLAFIAEPFRMRGWKEALPSAPFSHRYRDQSYLTRGNYGAQLKYLYSLVPKEQVLVIQQEALRSQHKKTLADIFAFLGLPDSSIEAACYFSGEYAKPLPLHARLIARLYLAWLRVLSG